MTNKIKIKMGQFEVECEGSEQFLKQELPELIKNVSQLWNLSLLQNKSEGEGYSNKDISLSTNNIAAKLKCKSGPDLVIAASAYQSRPCEENAKFYTERYLQRNEKCWWILQKFFSSKPDSLFAEFS
ncbi:MAG TPA: hypothetical protein VJA17_05700 [Candidatus Omnitrophota bacterium]|nr:hypothetical protein [Candidatus Omnitrophota bacterium]